MQLITDFINSFDHHKIKLDADYIKMVLENPEDQNMDKIKYQFIKNDFDKKRFFQKCRILSSMIL